MDVWRITLAALRRWYVLFPLLALTGFTALSVGDSIDPEYQATATIMYVEGSVESELPNPYGDLDGANQVAAIVLNSVETRSTLAAAGHTSSYEVVPQSRSSISNISIRSSNFDDAEQTGTALIEVAQQELVARQTDAGIPETSQVKLQVLEPPTVVAAVQDGKTRIQAVVAVIGASIALLSAVLFDDIVGLFKRAQSKRGRRQEKATATSAGRRGTEPGGATAPSAAAPTDDEVQLELDESIDLSNGSGDTSDDLVIHTNEWVWPGDVPPLVVEPPRRRNPFFDPEFTKRQRAGTKNVDETTDAEASTEPAHEHDHAAEESASEAAQKR